MNALQNLSSATVLVLLAAALLGGLIIGAMVTAAGFLLWLRSTRRKGLHTGATLAQVRKILEPLGDLVRQCSELAKRKQRPHYQWSIAFLNTAARQIASGKPADLVILAREMVRTLESWQQHLDKKPDPPGAANNPDA